MSDADELRRMLDERDVEYQTDDGRHARVTCWEAYDGKLALFAEYDDGSTGFSKDCLSLTPKQAVEVTLGI